MACGSAMPTRYSEHPNFMECTASAELVRRPRHERRDPSKPLCDVGDSYAATAAPESAGTRVTGVERRAQHLYTGSSERRSLRCQENRPVRRLAFVGSRVVSQLGDGWSNASARR